VFDQPCVSHRLSTATVPVVGVEPEIVALEKERIYMSLSTGQEPARAIEKPPDPGQGARSEA
jgi:hypothetical protein